VRKSPDCKNYSLCTLCRLSRKHTDFPRCSRIKELLTYVYMGLISGCLDVTFTHKSTMHHSDPHGTSTKYFVHCDIFLRWHSDSVTIFYCDIPTQRRRIICPPQKIDGLSQHDISTHCNFGQRMDVTLCPLQIWIFFVGFLLLKRLNHKIYGILRHCSMRFPPSIAGL
jgi:hypothetical protein